MRKWVLLGYVCALLSACATAPTDGAVGSQSSVEMYGIIDGGIGVQQIKR